MENPKGVGVSCAISQLSVQNIDYVSSKQSGIGKI